MRKLLSFLMVFVLVLSNFTFLLQAEVTEIEESLVYIEESIEVEEVYEEEVIEEFTEEEDSITYEEEVSVEKVVENIPLKEEAVYESSDSIVQASEDIQAYASPVNVTDEAGLRSAISTLSAGDSIVITLMNDITLTGAASASFPLAITGKTVTLNSYGTNNFAIISNTTNPGTEGNGRQINIGSGGSLILNNVTIMGPTNVAALSNVTNTAVYGGGIGVAAGGKLTINDGAVIRNIINTHGAIYLQGNSSNIASTTLIMNGGTITNNGSGSNGAGIYSTYSTVTMTGGTISSNILGNNDGTAASGHTADSGAGVYLLRSNFTMSGGTITNNTSWQGYGAGVSVYNGSTFIMNGGSITGNNAANTASSTGFAGGVYVEGSSATYPAVFTMNGGTISGNSANYGGGVSLASMNYTTFNFNGGSIVNNTARKYGGGIAVLENSTANLNSGIISGNTADWGGAILNQSGNLNLNGNLSDPSNPSLQIINNIASSYGGAIMVTNLVTNNGTYKSVTSINGAYISGNSAVLGGALMLNDINYPASVASTTSISNSIINNNRAQLGGGVFMELSYLTVNSSTFSNNVATADGLSMRLSAGGGGAIFYNVAGAPNEIAQYMMLTTGGDVIFEGNTALNTALPPLNAATTYPNLKFASTSVSPSGRKHILNNYDINFVGAEPLTLTINFNANGGSAIAPNISTLTVDEGDTYNLLSASVSTRQGYRLVGWSQSPTGTRESSDFQLPNAQLTSSATDNGIIWYAVWETRPFTLVFDANAPSTSVTNLDEVNASLATLTGVDWFIGNTFDVPVNTFLINNREPIGWSFDARATTPDFVGGETITLDEAFLNANSNASDQITLYAVYESVEVTFTLNVEGVATPFVSSPITLATNQRPSDVLPNLNTILGAYITNHPFTGNYQDSHVLSAWDSELSQFLYEDKNFTATLSLRRFTVTFVDPSVDLFGDQFNVPFGSLLLEPKIGHPEYVLDPTLYSVTGWYTGIITERVDALATLSADTLASATLSQMPGNDINENRCDLRARFLAIPFDSGIVVNPDSQPCTLDDGTLFVPQGFNILSRLRAFIPSLWADPDSGDQLYTPGPSVEEKEVIPVAAFNFAGTEADRGSGNLSGDVIVSDLVLTRQATPIQPTPPTPPVTPPVEDVLGVYRRPKGNLPITGQNVMPIIAASLGLALSLIIRKKYFETSKDER